MIGFSLILISFTSFLFKLVASILFSRRAFLCFSCSAAKAGLSTGTGSRINPGSHTVGGQETNKGLDLSELLKKQCLRRRLISNQQQQQQSGPVNLSMFNLKLWQI